MSKNFKQVRQEIDRLDVEIQRLIEKRVGEALKIARIKRESGDDVFYKPEREAQVLREVIARNLGPIPEDKIVRIFREIMSTTLAVESPQVITFLGPYGSFSHAAALKHFGYGMEAKQAISIEQIIESVESGVANYGLLPIENSIEGSTLKAFACLMNSTLKACGEISIDYQLAVLSQCESLGSVEKIIVQPNPFQFCTAWVESHLPHAIIEWAENSGDAAKLASEQSNAAAITTVMAAERYNLHCLAKNIATKNIGSGRYLVIGKQETLPSGDDKTSLLVGIKNDVGVLHDILKPLADAGISLSHIESHSGNGQLWDYLFFIEMEGHLSDDAMLAAMTKINSGASITKVIGSYPKSVL